MSTINIDDRDFLQRVVRDAVESGYIEQPTPGRGEDPSIVVLGGGPSFCCFCPSGRGGRNDGAVVLAVVLFAVSFFVGLFYTAQSARSAHEAQNDLSEARQKLNGYTVTRFTPPPTYSAVYAQASQDSYVPPAEAYAQPAYVSQQSPYPAFQVPTAPPADGTELAYKDAETLLRGRRNERLFAMTAQGVMTIGAAFLTVALLVSWIAQPEVYTVGLGISGAGLVAGGAGLWAVKRGVLLNRNEQAAANRIIHALRA